MFDTTGLRKVLIVVAVAILAAGSRRALENEGEEVTMEFVRIPAGSFQMGSPDSEKDRILFDSPVREVRITKPFYMGKYEVTQDQWEAVMGTTVRRQRDKADSPWRLKGEGPEHPMYYVSWDEAVEFCKRLGKEFRLPTEAEWEYACRAGSQTRFYYGDDPNYAELSKYEWYWDNSDGQTHPVGQKKPNAWGLYDMLGNVSEWCSDLFDLRSIYKNAGNNDSSRSVANENSFRVCRGGGWLAKASFCRSASRGFGWQHTSSDLFGFRVVYTGKIEGDKAALEIVLPEKAGVVEADLVSAPESRPQTIAGVVRDETGLTIDEVEMGILPYHGMGLRTYANGCFEISRQPLDPNAPMQERHLVARNKERNLAVGVKIEVDVNELEIKLKPGVILSGKVMGSDGKEIEKARVMISKLQTPNWSGRYLEWMETDSEGRFAFKALPPGYNYSLSARKIHYRSGQTEVHTAEVRDNRVDGVSIVLPRGPHSVSGKVVDINLKPLADVWVYCTGKEQVGINAHTNTDGKFKADGIFSGEVQISAHLKGNDGRWLGGSLNTVAGANDVTIVLDYGRIAPPPKGRACFPGQTSVWLDEAVVPISRVARGHAVDHLARAAPGIPFGIVERIEEHEGAFECRDISLESGNRISVVDSHCFMLDCGRWIAAQDLRAGQRLKTITGTVGIKSVTIRPTPYTGKVYNLKISNSDRYAVGKDGVIVRDY